MNRWNIVVSFTDGSDVTRRNSLFKIRGGSVFCIETDTGKGDCIPLKSISKINISKS